MQNYKLLHTCIRVFDLDKSIEFYKKTLGFTVTSTKDKPESRFTLVFLSDESKHHEIELTYNYDQDVPYQVGNGYSHIAVNVVNLEESHAYHKSLGVEITDMYGLAGEAPRMYFITDPDGYEIEVLRR